MSKKFQFVGGARDGQSIDLGRDSFDIDFAVALPDPNDPTIKAVFKLQGDGKFHLQLPAKSSKSLKAAALAKAAGTAKTTKAGKVRKAKALTAAS